MDPYLEDPALWPDFHDRFAEQVSAMLNGGLPPDYYAQLGVREEVGIHGGGIVRRIIPDVAVTHTAETGSTGGSTAVLVAEPRVELDPVVALETPADPDQVSFIEIIDSRTGHEVVTIIEILSPSNKQNGVDRIRYVRKRDEILASQTSLIEIDLLLGGDRSIFDASVEAAFAEIEPAPQYLAVIDRAWQRRPQKRLHIAPAWLDRLLPVIAVPLREGEPECTLDLQYAFQQTYERGPYRRGAVDYGKPASAPLPEKLRAWASERVASLAKLG